MDPIWTHLAGPKTPHTATRLQDGPIVMSHRPCCSVYSSSLRVIRVASTFYLGNHEHAHIGGPRTSLFARDEATALEQRIGIEASLHMASFFRSLPIVAWAPCGLLFSHAAPAVELLRIEDLEAIDYRRYIAPRRTDKPRSTKSSKPGDHAARLLGQLLWEHVLPPFKAQSLLARVNAQIAVYGHTIIPTGYQTIGFEQLILSTSFGMRDEHKTVLLVDLDEHYLTVDSLRPGIELLPLYEHPS